jgi:hypothetical protein
MPPEGGIFRFGWGALRVAIHANHAVAKRHLIIQSVGRDFLATSHNENKKCRPKAAFIVLAGGEG